MNEFLVFLQSTYLVELFLDKILHGLHVVVGHLLYVFHALRILQGEILINSTQTWEQFTVETLQLWQR